jgi:gamma-glutamyltranspeptidase / glutathione hydrolase
MHGMIAALQPQAVEEGAKVLMQGGNAIDAAVTCAFVQGILDPQMCGIGGYAQINLHLTNAPTSPSGALGVTVQDQSIVIDGPALAGSKVSEAMWADQVLGSNPDGWGYFLKGKVNDAGYTSICTPGWVKTMATILERWGTISWAQALAPAAQIAEEGFVVTERMAVRWLQKARYSEACCLLDYIQANPEAQRIYLKADGSTYEMGERLRNPEYANTLRHLGRYGPEDFYTGELAARMMTDLSANGSFVTAEDLATYQLREAMRVAGTYRGYGISSTTAPHGGPTLIAILNILEGYELAALGHNSPEYIYLVSMAMKAAFADRNRTMADPEFNEVPVGWMISKERAAQWRDHIDAGKPIDASFMPTGTPDTTHVTVVDSQGNCVALTHSLGASSGVITPGLGFMYNNSMINFHPLPGHPNSIGPRKGRTTGMCPTIVTKGDKPVLVLGSPGATRIITSNVQVILNSLDFGMSMTEAVHAPRFDCQVADIRCHATIPEYVCAEVRKRHPITRIPQSHGGFALVSAVAIDSVTGKLSGAADTGSDGMALLV